MKYLLLAFSFLLLWGCRPSPQNNTETLNRLFEQNTVSIAMKHCGCFGCAEEQVKLVRKNGNWVYSGDAGETQELSDLQLSQIKNWFASLLDTNRQERCISTASTSYRLGDYWTYMTFQTNVCTESDEWKSILSQESKSESFKKDYDSLEE